MNYEFVRDDLPVCASSLDLEEPPAFVKQAMTSIGSKLQVKPLHQTIIYETCTSAIGENPLYEKLYPFQR